MKIFLSVAALALASAASLATDADLARAHRTIPGHSFLGKDIATMNAALNEHLSSRYGDVTKACESFSASELQVLQSKIYALADPSLLQVYETVDLDLPSGSAGRRRTEATMGDLEARFNEVKTLIADPQLYEVYRDGLCHQTVMWFVHHLSESARTELSAATKLPMLPVGQHDAPANPTAAEEQIHRVYDSHTTCQSCHDAGIANQGPIDPPIAPDPNHPGWDRIRRCDAACTGTRENGCVQYDPPCGPCDGVGGPYFGDALADFTPVNCKLVSLPEDVPVADRIPPFLPKQFKVSINGTDRLVRVQNPSNGTLYSEISGFMYVDEDRADGTLALRHDTYYERFDELKDGHVTEIHFQTKGMTTTNVTGPMWSTIAALKPFEEFPNLGYCTCVPDPVGVPKWDSFADAQYMGRITLDPIEYLNRTVIVDHYSKWFFHLFLDADKTSPTYKQVMRFYSPYAGFAVYHDWQFTAPENVWPEVWSDSLPVKGPSKCLNAQKVEKVCDVYYPVDGQAPWPRSEQAQAMRHPLMPSGMAGQTGL